jgi:hypothetical protein
MSDDLVECRVTADVFAAEDMLSLSDKSRVNASSGPPVESATLHLLGQILKA